MIYVDDDLSDPWKLVECGVFDTLMRCKRFRYFERLLLRYDGSKCFCRACRFAVSPLPADRSRTPGGDELSFRRSALPLLALPSFLGADCHAPEIILITWCIRQQQAQVDLPNTFCFLFSRYLVVVDFQSSRRLPR